VRERIRSHVGRRGAVPDAAGFAHIGVVLLVAVLVLLVYGLAVDPFAVVLAGFVLAATIVGALVITAVVLVARRRSRPRSPVVPLDVERLRRTLDDLVASARTKVSAPTLVKVQSIRRTVLEILPRSGALADDVERLYLVEQTVLDYLPTALSSYLELPTSYATTEAIRDGKTAQELLLEQITLLDDTMREIADHLNRQGSDRLVAHGRFLDERLRRRDRYLVHARFLDDKLRRARELRIDPPDERRPPATPA
jgi:hypothetical protein